MAAVRRCAPHRAALAHRAVARPHNHPGMPIPSRATVAITRPLRLSSAAWGVMVRAFLVAALAVVALGAWSASADAHAVLESTSPSRGAAVEQSPGRVVFRFSEPVEIAFGAVRVFDAKGAQVQAGDPFHPKGESSAVAVRLRPDLPRGAYTATYRVISADSHPVSGGFGFGFGVSAAAAPEARVDELLAGEGAGPVASVAFAAARTVQYGAISVGLGVLALLLLCWLPALRACAGASSEWREADSAFGARLRRLLHRGALAGALSAVAALFLQAATARGGSPLTALDGIADVLETRFGHVWGLGVITWLVVLGLATSPSLALPSLRPATVGATGLALTSPGLATAQLAAPVPRGWAWRGRALATAHLPARVLPPALLPGPAGHGSLQQPVAVMLPANVLHVLAGGAWIGGIAVLVLAPPAAARRLDEAD